MGTGTYTTYFIGKPRVASYSPTGRCTKGFVAFRPQQGSYDQADLHFIKDYWRPDSDGVRKELDTYANLEYCGVKFIATAIGGGDVGRRQVTFTQDYMDQSITPLRKVHCRIVLKEVGRPLITYENSGVLMKAIYFAIRGQFLFSLYASLLLTPASSAHENAWTLAGILHRDISTGNILLSIDGKRSYLIDWDLSKFEEDMGKGAAQPDGRSVRYPSSQ